MFSIIILHESFDGYPNPVSTCMREHNLRIKTYALKVIM